MSIFKRRDGEDLEDSGHLIAATEHLLVRVKPPVTAERIAQGEAMARHLAWLDSGQPERRRRPRSIVWDPDAIELVPEEDFLADEREAIREAFDLLGERPLTITEVLEGGWRIE
jgi:hypothetical protein